MPFRFEVQLFLIFFYAIYTWVLVLIESVLKAFFMGLKIFVKIAVEALDHALNCCYHYYVIKHTISCEGSCVLRYSLYKQYQNLFYTS